MVVDGNNYFCQEALWQLYFIPSPSTEPSYELFVLFFLYRLTDWFNHLSLTLGIKTVFPQATNDKSFALDNIFLTKSQRYVKDSFTAQNDSEEQISFLFHEKVKQTLTVSLTRLQKMAS